MKKLFNWKYIIPWTNFVKSLRGLRLSWLSKGHGGFFLTKFFLRLVITIMYNLYHQVMLCLCYIYIIHESLTQLCKRTIFDSTKSSLLIFLLNDDFLSPKIYFSYRSPQRPCRFCSRLSPHRYQDCNDRFKNHKFFKRPLLNNKESTAPDGPLRNTT